MPLTLLVQNPKSSEKVSNKKSSYLHCRNLYRDWGQNHPLLSVSPHQSPSQNVTIMMKLVPKEEMNGLVVRIVVDSEKHHILRTFVLCSFTGRMLGKPELNQWKMMPVDTSFLFILIFNMTFYYIRSLFLLVIPFKIKNKGKYWKAYLAGVRTHKGLQKTSVSPTHLHSLGQPGRPPYCFIFSSVFNVHTWVPIVGYSEQYIRDSWRRSVCLLLSVDLFYGIAAWMHIIAIEACVYAALGEEAVCVFVFLR